MLVIAHDQLADRSVNRLAEAQSGLIRFCDRAPASVLTENGLLLLVNAHHREIDYQRLAAVNAQRRGGEEGPFGAMRNPIAQHATRRTAGLAIHFFVVSNFVIEKALNLFGAGQPPDDREFLTRQSEVYPHTLIIIHA